MMWSRHVRRHIAAFADAALGPAETARVQRHLEGCASCRESLERHQAVAVVLRQMTLAEAPAEIWSGIESALRTPQFGPRPAHPALRTPHFALRPLQVGLVLAAAVLVMFGVGSAWWFTQQPESWDVVRLDRSLLPRVDDGQWLETTSSSTVAIRIGDIGRVELSPGTRLQLVVARPGEHRLNLSRGRISVEIVAPPRVFFVETPSSTVVDLGCAYTMEVEADGGGTLRVTQGWAALEWANRESLVPAGASARTHATLGPGTPSFDDASAALRDALEVFDVGEDQVSALAVVLVEARARDTLTLWHLMSRVTPAERESVFDRLVALTPLPDGVSREGALALNPEMMRRWREELVWTW